MAYSGHTIRARLHTGEKSNDWLTTPQYRSTVDAMTAAELAQLRNAVAREMHAQLALRGEVIELADIPEVAFMVAVKLRREFHIECQSDDEPNDN